MPIALAAAKIRMYWPGCNRLKSRVTPVIENPTPNCSEGVPGTFLFVLCLTAGKQPGVSEGLAGEAQEKGKCCKYRKFSRGLDLDKVRARGMGGSCWHLAEEVEEV